VSWEDFDLQAVISNVRLNTISREVAESYWHNGTPRFPLLPAITVIRAALQRYESPSAYVWSYETIEGVRKTGFVALCCAATSRVLLTRETATAVMGAQSFPFSLKLYSEDKVRLEPATPVQPFKAQQGVGA